MNRTSYNLSQGAEDASTERVDPNYRVLAYKEKVPTPEAGYQNKLRVLYSKNDPNMVKSSIPTRPLPSSPEKTLNAPDLRNDYYLNLLDWGANNMLAVALEDTVYLWNPSSGGVDQIRPCEDGNYVCSVAWLKDGGNYLAVGTSSNEIQLWDTAEQKKTRTMGGHSARVSSLAWNHHILSSGGKDSLVMNHDVRIAKHITSVLYGHDQEVCGLAWSGDGKYLASGGNDNKLCIYDDFSTAEGQARYVLTDHMAAVKALAWCPYQTNVLATGGGSADRCIKLWNASTGTLLNSVDTGSQVCSLKWNPHEKELLSSHGYAKNQLCLWKYPNMTLMKEFFAHESRILHLAVSPDGTVVCSAGADEKLAFWRIFGTSSSDKKKSATVIDTSSFSSFGRIRCCFCSMKRLLGVFANPRFSRAKKHIFERSETASRLSDLPSSLDLLLIRFQGCIMSSEAPRHVSLPTIPVDLYASPEYPRSERISVQRRERRRSLTSVDSSDSREDGLSGNRRCASGSISDDFNKDSTSPEVVFSTPVRRNSLPAAKSGNETPSRSCSIPRRGRTTVFYSYNGSLHESQFLNAVSASPRHSLSRTGHCVVQDANNPNVTIARISKPLPKTYSKRNSLRSTSASDYIEQEPSFTARDEVEDQKRYLQNLSKSDLRCMLDCVFTKLLCCVCLVNDSVSVASSTHRLLLLNIVIQEYTNHGYGDVVVTGNRQRLCESTNDRNDDRMQHVIRVTDAHQVFPT